MQLTIKKESTVGELKNQFALLFPNLKLEFFATPHSCGQGSPASHQLPDDTLLCATGTGDKPGRVAFEPGATVAQFEQAMHKRFGLSVQVFRRSGTLWLQSTKTDRMPLEEQNKWNMDAVQKLRFNINTLFL